MALVQRIPDYIVEHEVTNDRVHHLFVSKPTILLPISAL